MVTSVDNEKPRLPNTIQGTVESASQPRLLITALMMLAAVPGLISGFGVPLVPLVAADAGTTLGAAQWSVSAPLLVAAFATPLLGNFTRSRHRRSIIVSGMLVVSVGVLICALSADVGFLVFGRALQGVGIALAPLAYAVVADEPTRGTLAADLTKLSASGVVAAGLGFPVASLLAETGGLSLAYAVALVLAVGSTVLLIFALPATRLNAVSRSRGEEWLSASMIAVVASAVLVVVVNGAVWGWGSPATVVSVLVIVVVMASRVIWLRTHRVGGQRGRSSRPRLALVSAYTLVVSLGIYLLISTTIVLQQLHQSGGGGGSPLLVSGMLLTPYAVLAVLGAWIGRRLESRWKQTTMIVIGCVTFSVSATVIAVFNAAPAATFIAMSLAGIGSGLAFASRPRLLSEIVTAGELGRQLAQNQTVRLIGFAAGAALTPMLLAGLPPAGGSVLVSPLSGHGVIGLVFLAAGAIALALASTQGRGQGYTA